MVEVMTVEKNNMTKLNYGELHMYYSIKFDTTLPFKQLRDSIYKSNIVFNDEYQQKILDSFGFSFAKMNEEFQQKNLDSDDIHFSTKVMGESTSKIYQPMAGYESEYEITAETSRIELSATDASMSIRVVSTELEALQQRLSRLDDEYEVASEIYGNSFTENQDRIILLPLKAKLYNGKTVWIHAILFLFLNNMGILKLEIPLLDVETVYFKKNDFDSLVESIENCWKFNPIEKDITLTGVFRYYLQALSRKCKINIFRLGNEMKNILFVDFDGMPGRVNDIPKRLQEELYRIVSAPVPEHPYTSYSEEAKEHMEKYSWGKHGMRYIIKINGGVLSLIDKGLLNYAVDDFKEEANTGVLDESDYLTMCNSLANNLNANVEFAILIIMLKKANECNDIYNKSKYPKDLFKVRKEYNENILFINELQSSCWGSVIEQTAQIEKMMPYYVNSEINQSNQIALGNILKDREQQKNEHFMNFISIGSLMLSLIFGLSSIYEALTILHKAIGVINWDIPYVSLENMSVFIWLLLNIVIMKKIIIRK